MIPLQKKVLKGPSDFRRGRVNPFLKSPEPTFDQVQSFPAFYFGNLPREHFNNFKKSPNPDRGRSHLYFGPSPKFPRFLFWKAFLKGVRIELKIDIIAYYMCLDEKIICFHLFLGKSFFQQP